MEKKQIRQAILSKLQSLANRPEEKLARETQLYQELCQTKSWQQAECIGMIRSTPLEVATYPLYQLAWQEGKTVVVPKSLPNRQLAFYAVDEKTEYTTTKFGVEEPLSQHFVDKTNIQLLIVPGVAFKKEGYRIGYGGGFYDRYLADYTGETISLVFKEQLITNWQPQSFDLPVQQIIIA
ncbi:5-formyltetrahydrofolate cyclo-ligase [Enterococcus columbae]|uniref:5-formyltetrahydrofolate cyclo-ligase n=1 Tax=Enterococcus columbae DSM 7374 = ATCC 51263 TaxID=1121865 RepID=S1NEX8_9ENTE|nr:5-formyltetrahydrofolate cyclo-ligase [Enterococcus columbae]EOT42472.1 5-formyltetrahydrofolate cyclo-ligase [Enterococcus columbae DSM 7374 = ATCC 51263]EOW87592.1 5-formyltetrahydrofolate cyclo-ligase [Enterococcus columbae DSM 7374 = ATCC 51263]OJG23147.1 5-formyltetrahydrofolate cyclo-ligase [Enterococcus columbae DSM 7374 = ATCC 51263]